MRTLSTTPTHLGGRSSCRGDTSGLSKFDTWCILLPLRWDGGRFGCWCTWRDPHRCIAGGICSCAWMRTHILGEERTDRKFPLAWISYTALIFGSGGIAISRHWRKAWKRTWCKANRILNSFMFLAMSSCVVVLMLLQATCRCAIVSTARWTVAKLPLPKQCDKMT